jgi:hypothetical protein
MTHMRMGQIPLTRPTNARALASRTAALSLCARARSASLTPAPPCPPSSRWPVTPPVSRLPQRTWPYGARGTRPWSPTALAPAYLPVCSAHTRWRNFAASGPHWRFSSYLATTPKQTAELSLGYLDPIPAPEFSGCNRCPRGSSRGHINQPCGLLLNHWLAEAQRELWGRNNNRKKVRSAVGEIGISWGVLTILGYPCDSLEFIEHVWRFYWRRHRLLGTNFSPVAEFLPLAASNVDCTRFVTPVSGESPDSFVASVGSLSSYPLRA